MFAEIFRVAARNSRAVAVVLAASAPALVSMTVGAAAQQSHEITVTVKRFQALDKADELSNGDFFARVTIDGKSETTPVISDKAEVTPDWKITQPVSPGVRHIKVELIDKDVSVDDPIDINRLPNKRDLDFSVNTNTGRVDGFAESYKVGQTITRAGSERKKASISFQVDVKKN